MLNYTQKLAQKNIVLPTWINQDKFISTILSLEGTPLYEAFGFKDSTSCTKFLSKYIPNKPKGMKFSKHLKIVLDIDTEVEVVPELELDPQVQLRMQKMDKFMEIYKVPKFMRRKHVETLSAEGQCEYAAWEVTMTESENFT